MGRDVMANYVIQPVDGLHMYGYRIGFNKFSALPAKIKEAAETDGDTKRFIVYGQTGIGEKKIEKELAKLGELESVVNVNGASLTVKRWALLISVKTINPLIYEISGADV